MKLSEKIIQLRKVNSWSQEDLAEKLDISRQAISRWENGTALPDSNNLLQLSKLFNVTADYLLNEQGCNIDLCGYPHEEEEVLAPLDTIREYQERRTTLNAEIDMVLSELEALLPGGVKE